MATDIDPRLLAQLASRRRFIGGGAAAAPTLTPRVYAAVERNAFALPNGAILVTAGLLVELENEAQLAFLLGHEAAHVLLRHQLLDERFQHIERIENFEIYIPKEPETPPDSSDVLR